MSVLGGHTFGVALQIWFGDVWRCFLIWKKWCDSNLTRAPQINISMVRDPIVVYDLVGSSPWQAMVCNYLSSYNTLTRTHTHTQISHINVQWDGVGYQHLPFQTNCPHVDHQLRLGTFGELAFVVFIVDPKRVTVAVALTKSSDELEESTKIPETLSPIIMEVENGYTWNVTILLEIHPFLTSMIMGGSVSDLEGASILQEWKFPQNYLFVVK